jgi:long-chain acyl-CoA synthetase
MVMPQEVHSFPGLFYKQVERLGDKVALRHKDYGIWNRLTWQQYGRHVREAAAALISLGIDPGDRVSILGTNRPEWLICHLATMATGGATCGVYPTNAPEQVAYVVGHSESRVLFVENEEQVDKVLQIINDLDRLTTVVIWDREGLWGFAHERCIFYDAFMEQGRQYLAAHPTCVDERMAAIAADDTAVIIYTSGTTGRPKGAMLSHNNILKITESFATVNATNEKDEMLSYLPLAHIYENMISLFQAVWGGGTVNFVESLDTLTYNLREVSPTVFASVPRIWEKFASAIEIKMDDSTFLKKRLYRLAKQVGLKWVRTPEGAGRFWISLAYWPLYWGVLYHLKRQLGFERVRVAVCGAAPASPDLFEFYNALGIPLREGYGQTESTGVIALQSIDRPRWGYVGEVLPGVQVRIAEDGEILAAGPGVFKGYFKDEALTAETIKDGWLHTGDVGTLDDGYLKILDRKKDIIITAGGKNITPSFIENKLKFSPYIQDAVVIGEGRKFLSALILIDEDNVNKYAKDHRVPYTTFADLTQNEEIVKLLAAEVAKVNKELSQVEGIKKFRLLPRRFYEEDGDVTPTMKVKRRFLEERYKDLIDAMYKG